MVFVLKEQAHIKDKLNHVQIQRDADTDKLLATMKLGRIIYFRHPNISLCQESIVCNVFMGFMKPFEKLVYCQGYHFLGNLTLFVSIDMYTQANVVVGVLSNPWADFNISVPEVGYIRLKSRPPLCRELHISDWHF